MYVRYTLLKTHAKLKLLLKGLKQELSWCLNLIFNSYTSRVTNCIHDNHDIFQHPAHNLFTLKGISIKLFQVAHSKASFPGTHSLHSLKIGIYSSPLVLQ